MRSIPRSMDRDVDRSTDCNMDRGTDRLTRRDLLVNGTMAAAWIARPRALHAASPEPVSVQVAADQPLSTIPPGFLGLGYEISSVAVPGLFSASNLEYVQLLRTLSTAGVLRIGGNTADNSARYAAGVVARSSTDGTIINDSVLHGLGGFLGATGWKLIWSLNLGTGSDKDRIAEARAVEAAAGASLLAFEIGNEPDLYAGRHRGEAYDYKKWLHEFEQTRDALRKALGRDVPLAGPDVAGDTDWVARFAHDEGRHIALLTEHYYRGDQKAAGTTIAKLLGPDPRLTAMLQRLHQVSTESGVPYRITEANSFSGGGRPGVSNTLASALWALEFCYTLAANGCSGVNIETGLNQLGTISAYSPIVTNPGGQPSVRPEYYGLLAFAQGGPGTMVKTSLGRPASLATPASGVMAFATMPVGGGLHIALLNKGGSAVTAQVGVSGMQAPHTASVVRLAGKALSATSGATLGGAAVTDRGLWQPGTEEFLTVQEGHFDVPLPAASAALVSLP